MKRLGHNVFFNVLACAAAASLAACGGSGSHSAALPQPVSTSPAASAPYTGPLADATFKISIPGPSNSAFKRRPSYVSSATKSLKFIINSSTTVSGTATTGTLGTYNGLAWSHFDTGTLPSAACPVDGGHAGNFLCTVTLKLPPGTDQVKISACDVTGGTCAGTAPVGNILSQQVSSFAVVVATANNFSITLDANTTNMTITATSGFCAGSFTVANSGTVGTVGTTAVTFNAAYKDLAGKTIVAPGLPVLTVNGHTDDNGGAGYTDVTTHLNTKVNQANQTFTLTQTAGTGSAAVSVTSTPNSAGDALTFNNPLSFTFSSGAAPPASFLANAQQIINGSGVVTGGQINFYTLTLGGSDSFSAFSPASLSNQSNDVDFPNDLLFDTNSDLLIANGGAGNPDFGNFACVPAGSITTGANNATVLTSGLSDPASLALGTDSSVALLNKGNTPTDLMAEFVLNGTYSPAPVSRDVLQSAYPSDGAHESVVALPTTVANPAGSYAMAFTDHTQAGTHIIIKHPDGTVAEFPQDASDVFPYITYDPSSNNQIVAANHNGTSSHITFWSVASMTKVQDIIIENSAGSSQGQAAGPIASSADGHIAVIITGASGFPELVVYDNTAARAKVGGVIDYGATTAAFGATFVYGGTVSANSANKLLWLSNTKLLVNLYSQHTHVATGANGMYIYDITQTMAQTGFDGNGNPEQTPVIKQTGFQSLTNAPLSAAYKP